MTVAVSERELAVSRPAIKRDCSTVCGVAIDRLGMKDVLERCEVAIDSGTPLHIGVVNAAKLVAMRRNPRLRAAVLQSDLILADGMAVVWASRVSQRRLPERVAGIDLFLELMRKADEKSWSVYFLGATKGVVEAVVTKATNEWPRMQIAGYRDGYFSREEAPDVAEAIGATAPDILFVAMTSPKKEEFMAAYATKMRALVTHGVGGSFDVFAGKTRRAPSWMQRLGLEWLYRVRQEPRRLWKRYLVTNSVFTAQICLDVARRVMRRERTRIGVSREASNA